MCIQVVPPGGSPQGSQGGSLDPLEAFPPAPPGGPTNQFILNHLYVYSIILYQYFGRYSHFNSALFYPKTIIVITLVNRRVGSSNDHHIKDKGHIYLLLTKSLARNDY